MLPEAHSAKYAVNLLFASSLAVRVENAMPSVPVWTLPMWYVKIILFLIDEYQMVSISTFGSELEKSKFTWDLLQLRDGAIIGWGERSPIGPTYMYFPLQYPLIYTFCLVLPVCQTRGKLSGTLISLSVWSGHHKKFTQQVLIVFLLCF